MKKAALLLLLLTACTSNTTGKSFNPTELPTVNSKSSEIVVYRPKKVVNRDAMLSLNGKELCKIGVGDFIVLKNREPGKTVFSSEFWDVPGVSYGVVNAVPGQRHYVLMTYRPAGFNPGVMFGAIGGAVGGLIEGKINEDVGPFLIKEVPEDVALKELATLRESQSCRMR